MQIGSFSQYTNKLVFQQTSVPWQTPTNKEQSTAPLTSSCRVKQEHVEQSSNQIQQFQSSNSQCLSTASIERGNTEPGNLKDDSLGKQSSKVGFSTPTTMVPSNSVSPIANQLDPNVQRVDAKKARHWTVITSDVQQQIMTMNRKAREEWEKTQAEAQ